jgi:pimeloyl-ACP methyl ester carboxylesterase
MAEIERPDGALVHYDVSGVGAPVLLLGADGTDAGLAGARLITVHGRAVAEPFDYATVAADQLAVLDALGVREVDVVADGAGCAQAWRLAKEAPARVRSLVCLRPIGADDAGSLERTHRPFDEAMRVARAEGLAGVAELARRDGRFETNPGAGPFAAWLREDPAFLTGLSVERYIVLLGRYRDALWPAGSPYFSVSEEELRAITVPVLVVAGDDEVVARQLLAQLPSATAAEAGRDAIAEFLNRKVPA